MSTPTSEPADDFDRFLADPEHFGAFQVSPEEVEAANHHATATMREWMIRRHNLPAGQEAAWEQADVSCQLHYKRWGLDLANPQVAYQALAALFLMRQTALAAHIEGAITDESMANIDSYVDGLGMVIVTVAKVDVI